MKIRIAYMYEKGGASTLELLLSSKSMAEFLNRVENVSQISQYDRNMLNKYEELRASIKEQERIVEEESEAVNELMAERAAKKQEVQILAANTNDNISSYIWQISASEEEAAALRSEINSADNSIAALMQQAAEEAAAREAAEAEAASREENYEEDYEDNSDESSEDYEDSYEDSDYSEEEASGDNGESDDDYTESSESQGNSGEGTYLGNFKLTAYCNCAKCCGTAGKLTASGTVPTAGRTVAMAGVPFGTKLLINGNVYTVEDLGTPYGHVDIFFNSHSDALSFGLQSADVYQLQ